MVRIHCPPKISDYDLFSTMKHKIQSGNYLFVRHATNRLKERHINDLAVLDILEREPGRLTSRNKARERYETAHKQWNDCFEGYDYESTRIRVIVSFCENLLVIITVIRLKDRSNESEND